MQDDTDSQANTGFGCRQIKRKNSHKFDLGNTVVTFASMKNKRMLKMWKNIARKQRTTTNFTAHNKLYVYQK